MATAASTTVLTFLPEVGYGRPLEVSTQVVPKLSCLPVVLPFKSAHHFIAKQFENR